MNCKTNETQKAITSYAIYWPWPCLRTLWFKYIGKLRQSWLLRSLVSTQWSGYYTVNHKNGGSTFVVVTLENLDGF